MAGIGHNGAPVEVLRTADVYGEIRRACAEAGGQATWAKRHGMSAQFVCDVLATRRRIDDRIMAALGLVPMYAKMGIGAVSPARSRLAVMRDAAVEASARPGADWDKVVEAQVDALARAGCVVRPVVRPEILAREARRRETQETNRERM